MRRKYQLVDADGKTILELTDRQSAKLRKQAKAKGISEEEELRQFLEAYEKQQEN
jgi:hypothetical protein